MMRHIEPKIRPLVDALNRIEGVSTGLSTPGQVWPCCSPFVEIGCSVEVAKMIDGRLRSILRTGVLSYWWGIDASFLGDGELQFRLRSRPLRALDILFGRRRIDRDLSVLADQFISDPNNFGPDFNGVRQALPNEEASQGQCDEHQKLCLKRLLAERVAGVASRAFGCVRGNSPTANFASYQFRHGNSFPLGTCIDAWKIARSLAVVILLSTTLAACGSSREIQKDGSGTDEMLRSPCACMPLDYEAPNFKWGVG